MTNSDLAGQAPNDTNSSSKAPLVERRCVPCEGGVPAWSREHCEEQLLALPGWSLDDDGRKIAKRWRSPDFLAAVKFFQDVAELAESEGHHPDLHLVSYRKITIEIWTHAIGGLSENDFILAAKIDRCALAHPITAVLPLETSQSG